MNLKKTRSLDAQPFQSQIVSFEYEADLPVVEMQPY